MQCGRRTNGYVALFVFAALVGLLGQTVVPWLSDQLNSPHLGFRFLVSNIDIYPFVVVGTAITHPTSVTSWFKAALDE